MRRYSPGGRAYNRMVAALPAAEGVLPGSPMLAHLRLCFTGKFNTGLGLLCTDGFKNQCAIPPGGAEVEDIKAQ